MVQDAKLDRGSVAPVSILNHRMYAKDIKRDVRNIIERPAQVPGKQLTVTVPIDLLKPQVLPRLIPRRMARILAVPEREEEQRLQLLTRMN